MTARRPVRGCNRTCAPAHTRPLLSISSSGGDAAIDPERLRLGTALPTTETMRRNPRLRRGRFLKGPVALEWLRTAGKLPGKALHVGVVIWYLSGLQSSRRLVLSQKEMLQFGVDRYARHRALRLLEAAGLVGVERAAGRLPVGTIIEVGPENAK